MSKYDSPTVTAKCPACAVESLHRVVFENAEVRHLRCDECAAAHVIASKGSFHADIHALSISDVIDAAKQGETEPYNIRRAFHPTDSFAHPKFGIGYVFAILSPPQKMEALFADKARFLVCGPGSGLSEQEAAEEIEVESKPATTADEEPKPATAADEEPHRVDDDLGDSSS